MIAPRSARLQSKCNLPRQSQHRPQRNTCLEGLTDCREVKNPDREQTEIQKIMLVSRVSDDLGTIIF